MNRSKNGHAKNRTLTLKEKNSTVPKDYEIRTTELIHQAAILKNEWNEASLRKAIESLSEALLRLKAVNNRSEEPAVLHEIGEIYLILSDYRAALRSHMEELSVSMKPSEKAHSLNALAEVHIYLGEYQKARSYSQQALKLSRQSKDTEAQANSLVNIGEIHYFQGNSQRALSFLGEALMVLHDQPWTKRARALLNLGYAHFDLRNIEEAQRYYGLALSQARSDGNKRHEALALTAMGGTYSYLGNKQTALEYQNRAVSMFREIGDRNGEGVSLNGLGYVYRNLGEYQKSLDCYIRALNLFKLLGNREYETFTLTRVGKAYEGLGQESKALEYYRLALKQSVGYSQTKAHALDSIGNIFELSGDQRQAISYYLRALTLFRITNDKMGESMILNSIGQAYSSQGQRAKALTLYNSALAISRRASDRRGALAVLLNIALTQREAGLLEEARKSIEDSLHIIEAMRTEVISPALKSSYFASVHQHYEIYIDILMQLHRKSPEKGFAEKAFAASEKARARLLMESLGEDQSAIKEGVDAALLERMTGLQHELNRKAEQHMRLVSNNQVEDAAELARQIDELMDQYDQVESEMRSKSPRFAALTQPQPQELRVIQDRVLDGDSMLLEYALGDERSYLWAVSKNEVLTYELPRREEIELAARKLYDLLSFSPVSQTHGPQGDVTTNRKEELQREIKHLSKILLGPVSGKLSTRRLLIVPDGLLQYIPFQILTEQYDDEGAEIQPLLGKHEIVNEPSATVLGLLESDAATRPPPPKSVAILADPVFELDDPRIRSVPSAATNGVAPQPTREELNTATRDVILSSNKRLPRLLASREEAEAIISVTPYGSTLKAIGFDANHETATRLDLKDYRVVHFATHGLLNNEHPELSGIVLSLYDQNGKPQDGFLRLHEIYNLKLPVDLVVLSACNTGVGKQIKGEGLISVTRGFMYAGASGIVASLWKVDDEATAELMRYFYTYMFQEGLSPASALREAQLKLSRQKRWQSPYYWSGFIVQGLYNDHVGAAKPNRHWWLLGGGFAVLLLIAVSLFALERKRRSSQWRGPKPP